MNKVVAVDDVRNLADSLAMLLTLTGHPTRTAYNCLEAVNAAAAERPDVVVRIPTCRSWTAFARRARSEAAIRLGRGQHVLHQQREERLDHCGFDPFLTKSAAIEKLMAIADHGSR